jgi:hypothetical protein
MQEKKYPVEYVKRAKELVDARKQAEKDLRDSLTPAKGRDDRLCGQLRELDEQLRIDLAALRTEFGV